MPSLLVRVDASPEIGAGHAVRCLALAQAWIDAGGTASVCTRSLTNALRTAYAREGIPIVTLASDDPDEVRDLLDVTGPGWLVLDGYALGDVRPAPGSITRSLAVDDHGLSHAAPATLVVDQNLGADAAGYPGTAPSGRLLGPTYALLRRWFRVTPQPSRRTPARGPLRILVSLGGSSRPDLAAELTQVGDRLRTDGHHVVAIGPDFGERGTWLPDLPRRLPEFDLAVTAAGSITWELCWAGVPMLVFPVAPNQEPVADALARHGAAAHLPPPTTATDMLTVIEALVADRTARVSMAERQQALVDGQGAARVVDAMHRHDATDAPEPAGG